MRCSSTESTAEGAEITLGIFKGETRTIPENVTGSIVPKTLFGEKYVSLIVPEDPSPEHITADDGSRAPMSAPRSSRCSTTSTRC